MNTANPDTSKPAFALACIRRGWKVFPITPGKATPPLVRWGTEHTGDEAVVRAWWSKWPTANVGIACGPSGLCVVDLDLKGGKDGRKELDRLEVLNDDLPATLTARTPSGGYHIYLKGTARTTVNLGGAHPGIDTRSGGGQGGYVLAPGSTTSVGEYTWVGDPDKEVAPLPDWLRDLAGVRADRQHTDEAVVEPDQPHNVEWAVHHLREDAKPAVQGQGGNDTTFRVACTLRDKGISETLCHKLMLEHYSPRCEPPWDDDELETVVGNAYRYASVVALGGDTAEADFADDPEFPDAPDTDEGERLHEQDSEHPDPGSLNSRWPSRFLSREQILNMPPPTWLIKNLVPDRTIGVLYGASGSLKSFLAFHLAAACATGAPEAFPGYPCKRADAFYIAGEDPAGFKVRLAAWEKHFKAEAGNLQLLPGSTFLEQPGEVAKLVQEISEQSLEGSKRLIVVDTLSTNFAGDENSADVGKWLGRCVYLSQQLSAVVLVVHHTGKDRSKGARGHSSIKANTDFVLFMEAVDGGASVVAEKFKNSPTGGALNLRSLVVEVYPGQEFGSSLVLEMNSAADDFPEDDEETRIRDAAAGMNGRSIAGLIEWVAEEMKLEGRTARRRIYKAIPRGEGSAVGHHTGLLWLEPKGGSLTVRFQ